MSMQLFSFQSHGHAIPVADAFLYIKTEKNQMKREWGMAPESM